MPDRKELVGLTRPEICKKFNVCKNTVDTWLAKTGITAQNLTKLKSERNQLKRKLEALNRWAYFAPAFVVLTDAQLARAFNLTRERVRQIRIGCGWECVNKKEKIDIDKILV